MVPPRFITFTYCAPRFNCAIHILMPTTAYAYTVTPTLNSGLNFKTNLLHIKEHFEMYIDRIKIKNELLKLSYKSQKKERKTVLFWGH